MVYLLGFRASGLGDPKRDPSFRELPTGAFDGLSLLGLRAAKPRWVG